MKSQIASAMAIVDLEHLGPNLLLHADSPSPFSIIRFLKRQKHLATHLVHAHDMCMHEMSSYFHTI